jgi:hypothetical protein
MGTSMLCDYDCLTVAAMLRSRDRTGGAQLVHHTSTAVVSNETKHDTWNLAAEHALHTGIWQLVTM